MTQRDALEAICAGLVKAVLALPHETPTQKRRHRTRAASASEERTPPPTQTSFELGPPPVPEFSDGAVAAPFSQREYEMMEAKLRGETPKNFYVPEDGQEPWKG